MTRFENRRSETGPQGGETLGQPLAGLGQALRGSPTVGLRPRLLTVHRFAVKVQPGFEFRFSIFDGLHDADGVHIDHHLARLDPRPVAVVGQLFQ